MCSPLSVLQTVTEDGLNHGQKSESPLLPIIYLYLICHHKAYKDSSWPSKLSSFILSCLERLSELRFISTQGYYNVFPLISDHLLTYCLLAWLVSYWACEGSRLSPIFHHKFRETYSKFLVWVGDDVLFPCGFKTCNKSVRGGIFFHSQRTVNALWNVSVCGCHKRLKLQLQFMLMLSLNFG